ncbi:MAG: aspartate kinase [Spirochaetales bacterium]|nr:aspartate kinase [Spirochaetales bacterium]
MKILKFGGTSVKDAGHIRSMVDILARLRTQESGGFHVVCSAMKGITDQLITIARTAEAGDQSYKAQIEAIGKRQQEAVADLFAPEGLDDRDNQRLTSEVLAALARKMNELRDICHGVFLVRECSLRSLDLVMSFGERLNNYLVARYLDSLGIPSVYVDARALVITDDSHGRGVVQFERTNTRIRDYFSNQVLEGMIAVITGFIGSTEKGITTTLGRNGSDYTASIFGAALGCSDIEIWTDVDGVLEADPRVVPGAQVIDDLSIEEAMEMSYFGAEVLHPSTMLPAVETNIPIWIKNTMNPIVRGTRISRNPSTTRQSRVTGIASIPKVTMINLVGGGLIGSKGIAGKIFGALGRSDANIIMISQASSEHSICVVIREEELTGAKKALQSELAHELRVKQIQNIEITPNLEVVSIIGGGMRGTPGVSGKLFSSLGQAGVNVVAIAQGSSEMNISLVIHSKDHSNALQAIHRGFFAPDAQDVTP